jgi:hypothetical protein
VFGVCQFAWGGNAENDGINVEMDPEDQFKVCVFAIVAGKGGGNQVCCCACRVGCVRITGLV